MTGGRCEQEGTKIKTHTHTRQRPERGKVIFDSMWNKLLSGVAQAESGEGGTGTYLHKTGPSTLSAIGPSASVLKSGHSLQRAVSDDRIHK